MLKGRMRLAIVGSRHFRDYELLKRTIDEYQRQQGEIDIIISGGAKGADALAEQYARENGIPTAIYPADWDTHGRKAGPMRNTQIANECTHCIAFCASDSVGTRDTISKVKNLGKKLHVVHV